MKAIQEQQEAFRLKGQKLDSDPAPPVSKGNLAAERMKAIQEQQEAFRLKGQKTEPAPPVSRGNLAAERMKAIQEQQKAFSLKGQKTEPAPPVSRGNLAAEKMAAINAQMDAFSKKGQKPEVEDEPKEEEATGLKALANQFGDTVKPKSAVQKAREELERKQKEEATKNDPKAFQKVSWSTGSGYGQYDKKVKDSRGIAPKKTLSDLP